MTLSVNARERKRTSFVGRYLTLFGGELFGKLCTLAAFAYLARVLSPADFGRVELSLSVTLFFVIFVDCGLGLHGARMIATDPASTPQLVARIGLVRAMLAVPAYAVILWLSARFGMPGLGILAIYGVTVLLVPFFTQWVFQGMGRMQWVAAGTALRYATFAACILLWLRPGADPRLVAVAEVVGALALVLFNAGVYRSLGLRSHWNGALGGAGGVFKDAWPLGASQLASVALWHSPQVVLGMLAEPEEVAWLAGSLRIVLALNTFVSLYFFNLLPRLSTAFAQDPEAGRKLTDRSIRASMWLACLVALAIGLLAPAIATTVYGAPFGASAAPLRIAILVIPLSWLGGHFRHALIATGHQRSDFYAALGMVAGTIVPALLLLPGGGSAAAALCILAGAFVNTVLGAGFVRRRVGRLDVIGGVAQPAGVALVCAVAAAFLLIPALGEIAGSAVALAGYAAMAGRDHELVRLRQVWIGR